MLGVPSGSTHHSTGPARKAALADEFKRPILK